MEERLQKVLAESGIASRRKCEEYIEAGRVSVNGKIVKPSYEVKVGDIVEIQFGDKISKFEIIKIPKIQEKNITESIKLL